MEIKKILGFTSLGLGLVSILASFPEVTTALKITLPESIAPNTLVIAGIVLLGLGIVLTYNKREKQAQEVPIYHGKNIVGYRRH
jgi:LPXTG-motif cell wall-anchored protein